MLVIVTFLINAVFNFALGLLIARFLGPAEFGKYAIAFSIAIALNVGFLDWIRHSATRYYSGKTRADDPAVRATLDAIFLISALGVVAISLVALALGADFGLSLGLAATVPAMGLVCGLYDYHTAIARARFDDRTFSRIVIVKNVSALFLMILAAWWTASPVVVALGLCLSVAAALLSSRRALVDPGAVLWKPDWRSIGRYALYGLPLVAASLLYALLPLTNRMAIAGEIDFAASGQFSLALDTGLRLVQTLGSALDILLFQIAVKVESEKGLEEARERLSLNMGIVIAGVTAVALGYWLVLPSFERLFVPDVFRSVFSEVTAALLPGLVALALLQAAVTPVFQLLKRTWPVIIVAAVALGLNALLVHSLAPYPRIVDFARAQSFALVAALAVGLALALAMVRALPRPRDILVIAIASALMIGVVWPIRALEPGVAVLAASALAGGLVFAVTILGFDAAGLGKSLREKVRGRRRAV
jgi:O-antigen/teichoic acid export membrane protein